MELMEDKAQRIHQNPNMISKKKFITVHILEKVKNIKENYLKKYESVNIS